MHRGYVPLWRKTKGWACYKRSQYVHLWIHLLLSVNNKEDKFMWNGEVIVVKEGQILTGRKQLSKETGIPESTIEDILKTLEKQHQIQQQKTTKFRLVTIVNWRDYRCGSTAKATTEQQQSDTNKNDKNDNKLTEEVFSLETELDKLSNAKRPDLRLVAYYFRRKKMKIPSKAVFRKELGRALAEAKTLKDFPRADIERAMGFAEQKYELWSLQTVGKLITNIK